jgi:hypothetical protein
VQQTYKKGYRFAGSELSSDNGIRNTTSQQKRKSSVSLRLFSQRNIIRAVRRYLTMIVRSRSFAAGQRIYFVEDWDYREKN